MTRVSACCFLMMLLASHVVRSQDDVTHNYMHKKNMMDRLLLGTGNNVALGNLSSPTPGVVGDVYLTKEFKISTFWLYDNNSVAKDLAARLDLQRNEFDIHMGKGNGIRSLSGSRVRSVVMSDSVTLIPKYFINGQEYKNEEDIPYLGFFQILAEGELSLLKFTTVTFKPADTNPTHSTGSADHRFMKKSKLYYAQGSKAIELPNRRGILKLMESRQREVNDYIKLNDINLGDERHLVILFDYYNTITKK